MDEKALIESVDKIGKSFEAFKATNDERITQLEKKGVADPVTKEQLAKIEKDLADMVTEKDKMIAKMKQLATAKSGESNEDEAAKEGKAMFSSYLRKGAREVTTEEGTFKIEGKSAVELKAMSVISDPDGGYMVTADMSGRVIKKIFETSDMRRVASIQAIGTDALEGVNDLNEASYGWVGETASRPATATPQLGKWRIPVHEMYAMPIVTQKLLDDANFNPEQWLSDKLADKFSRVENDAFVNGNGSGKPRGFLTYAAGTTLGSTIEQVNSGAAANCTTDGLINLVFALKGPYRARAQFGMNRLTIADIRKLKDSYGRYMWDPGINGGTQQTILGFGVNEFNDMPVPAANALAVAFADWKEFYQIVDRVGIRVLRDPYTNKPYVQFYSTKRTGGDVLNFEAGKIGKLSV